MDHKEESIAKTRAIVESTDNEKMYLWHKWHKEKGVTWVQDCCGYGIHVGDLGDMPVWISIHWATVDGIHIMFYHDTSMVVDHRLIKDWVDKTIQDIMKGGAERVVKTDSGNFHQVFHQLKVAG